MTIPRGRHVAINNIKQWLRPPTNGRYFVNSTRLTSSEWTQRIWPQAHGAWLPPTCLPRGYLAAINGQRQQLVQ